MAPYEALLDYGYGFIVGELIFVSYIVFYTKISVNIIFKLVITYLLLTASTSL
jgi:hypothetical protein